MIPLPAWLWVVALLLRVTVICLCGAVAAGLLARAPAAAHLALWRACLGVLLALPLLAGFGPGWQWAVLPAPRPAGHPAAAPLLPEGPHAAERPVIAPPAPARMSPSAEEERSPAPAPPVPVPVWVLWLLGAAAVLGRRLAAGRALRRLERASRDAPAAVRAEAAELAVGLGIRQRVRVRMGGAFPVPATWGWQAPVVVLPETALSWSPARLRAALLHELGHVRQADWLAGHAATAACALYWFHPGVWWIAARLRTDAEHACDDLVLASGVPASDYATCLVEVARMFKDPLSDPATRDARPLPGAIPMARTGRLAGRVHRILDPATRRRLTPVGRLLAGAGACALLLPVAFVHLAPRPAEAGPPARQPAPAAVVRTRPAAEDAARRSLETRIRAREAELQRLRRQLQQLDAGGDASFGARERALRERERALAARERALRAQEVSRDAETSAVERRILEDLETRARERELEVEQSLLRRRLEMQERELGIARERERLGAASMTERLAAQRQLERARLDLARATAERDRMRRMRQPGTPDEKARRELEAQREAVTASLRHAEAELELAREQVAVVEQQVKAGQRTLVDYERTRAEVEAAEAQLRILRIRQEEQRRAQVELERARERARERSRSLFRGR